MSQKINNTELRRLRNDVPIKDVIYALNIPWEMNDQIFRFICPCCKNLGASLHPNENLTRCFKCQKNFNPIDLTLIHLNKKFRTAINWLQTLSNLMQTEGYKSLISASARNSKMK